MRIYVQELGGMVAMPAIQVAVLRRAGYTIRATPTQWRRINKY